jgi:hypothetical protein
MRLSEKEFSELIRNHPELQKIEIKKNPKFRNKKIWIYNGDPYEEKMPNKKAEMVFDSKKEYSRYISLKNREEEGIIKNLERQKKIEILPDFVYREEKIRGIYYKADFSYVYNGTIVIEDVKPFDTKSKKYITTKDFSLKWKMLKNKYPDYVFVLV